MSEANRTLGNIRTRDPTLKGSNKPDVMLALPASFLSIPWSNSEVEQPDGLLAFSERIVL